MCAGPPCGSFVFVNMGTSQRSKSRPFGGPWAYVKKANQPPVLINVLKGNMFGGVLVEVFYRALGAKNGDHLFSLVGSH